MLQTVVGSIQLYDFLISPDRRPPDEAAARRGRPWAAPSRPAAGAGGPGAPGESGEGATAATLAQKQWQGGDAQRHISWQVNQQPTSLPNHSPPSPWSSTFFAQPRPQTPQESWAGHVAPLSIALPLQTTKTRDSPSKQRQREETSSCVCIHAREKSSEWFPRRMTGKTKVQCGNEETRLSKSSTDLHLSNSQNWKLDHKNGKQTNMYSTKCVVPVFSLTRKRGETFGQMSVSKSAERSYYSEFCSCWEALQQCGQEVRDHI